MLINECDERVIRAIYSRKSVAELLLKHKGCIRNNRVASIVDDILKRKVAECEIRYY